MMDYSHIDVLWWFTLSDDTIITTVMWGDVRSMTYLFWYTSLMSEKNKTKLPKPSQQNIFLTEADNTHNKLLAINLWK